MFKNTFDTRQVKTSKSRYFIDANDDRHIHSGGGCDRKWEVGLKNGWDHWGVGKKGSNHHVVTPISHLEGTDEYTQCQNMAPSALTRDGIVITLVEYPYKHGCVLCPTCHINQSDALQQNMDVYFVPLAISTNQMLCNKKQNVASTFK